MVSRVGFLTLEGDLAAAGASDIGPKTRVLARLRRLGYPVPPFVAVSGTALGSLFSRGGEVLPQLRTLAAAIPGVLPAESWAVRSSGLDEDGHRSSMAGRFSSATDVAPERLPEALFAVLSFAMKERKTAPERFSLMIQSFVRAERSGVLFTRDPLGGRQMIIEHAAGACSAVVSGATRPSRFERLWGSPAPIHEGTDFTELCRLGERIEAELGFAQDIEWCLAGGKFWILQSRAVTTISGAQFQGMRYLDSVLPPGAPVVFERSGASEAASQPAPATLSLLKRLYAAGGPVDTVFRSRGVRYTPVDFLRIVGADLFSDREQELRTLFPSKRVNASGAECWSFRSPREMWTSLRNMIALPRIHGDPAALAERIEKKLAAPPGKETSYASRLRTFLEEYSVIFEGNLLTEIALKRLRHFVTTRVPELSASLPSLLAEDEPRFRLEPPAEPLRGNSLELLDDRPFRPAIPRERQTPAADLPVKGWRAAYVRRLIADASAYSSLREAGRWLAVRNLNRLRESLFEISDRCSFERRDDVFFFTLEEIEEGAMSPRTAGERREARSAFDSIELPSRVSNVLLAARPERPLGVSPGRARGTLVRESELGVETRTGCILYAPMLSPDLADHFPKITGILADQGGMLSHLAILAREAGIPVIVHVRLNQGAAILGTEVEIDGGTGDIAAAP